jgi:hypothetical protein
MSHQNRDRATKILYWASTGLLSAALLMGGLSQLLHAPNVTTTMAHLGYPAYFSTIIGTWKTLGALALLAPALPRLKEWAYAGIAFNLSGAALSHLAVGDGAGPVIPPLFLLGLAAASWALRPARRKLGVAVQVPVAELAETRAAA